MSTVASDPKRIALLLPNLGPSGVATQVELLADGLRTSHSTEFAVNVNETGQRSNFDLPALLQLRKRVRDQSPALVHTWGFSAGAYGRLATPAGVVLVHTEPRLSQPRSRWHWRLDTWLARRTAALVACADSVRDHAIAQGVTTQKWTVIPSGIPSSNARTADQALPRGELLASLNLAAGTRLIGFVGALEHYNCLQQLIWVFDLIRVLHPHYCLLLVGGGTLHNELHRYADRASSLESIRFLGARSDVPSLLPHLDFYWHEGASLGPSIAVLEAMAAGVPVVLSDTPTHRELIGSERSGILVTAGDRASRARATESLITDREAAAAIGQAGQQRVLAQHSVKNMVDSYAQLYRRVLARRSES